MHRLPIVSYTLLAASLFLMGLLQLHFFEGPSGSFSNLVSAIILLLMASGVIYGGLVLKDDWHVTSKNDPARPKGPLLPVKKDSDA